MAKVCKDLHKAVVVYLKNNKTLIKELWVSCNPSVIHLMNESSLNADGHT